MKKSRIMLGFVLILALTASLAEGALSKKEFYRNLSKRLSNNRSDYAYLSDNEFANFREINTTGIG